MNTHTHTVQIRGADVAFRSAFATDADAIRALRDAGTPNTFAQDILRACSGAHASPRQIAWLHKLATEATVGRAVEEEHRAAQLPAPARLNRDDVIEAEAVAELQADEAAARGETDPFAGLGGL